jgi:hypothetical protein
LSPLVDASGELRSNGGDALCVTKKLASPLASRVPLVLTKRLLDRALAVLVKRAEFRSVLLTDALPRADFSALVFQVTSMPPGRVSPVICSWVMMQSTASIAASLTLGCVSFSPISTASTPRRWLCGQMCFRALSACHRIAALESRRSIATDIMTRLCSAGCFPCCDAGQTILTLFNASCRTRSEESRMAPEKPCSDEWHPSFEITASRRTE